MSNCTVSCHAEDSPAGLRECVGARFPDLRHLPKPGWGKVIAALLGPAFRLHRYRNLRSAMLYDALCKIDGCRDHE